MDIQTLLKDHHLYASKFQLEHFVVGNCVNDWACYQQSLRELDKRVRVYRETLIARERLDISLRQMSEEPSLTDSEKLDVLESQLAREQITRSLADVYREMLIIYNYAVTLKEKFPDLSDKRREALDRTRWADEVKKNAALDWMERGRLSRETFTMAHNLNDPLGDVLWQLLKNGDKVVKWWMGRELTQPDPHPVQVPAEELMGNITEMLEHG